MINKTIAVLLILLYLFCCFVLSTIFVSYPSSDAAPNPPVVLPIGWIVITHPEENNSSGLYCAQASTDYKGFPFVQDQGGCQYTSTHINVIAVILDIVIAILIITLPVAMVWFIYHKLRQRKEQF